MAIDKRLTGQNFCGLDCIDNQNIIHPETCVDNVVLSNDGTATINDWLSNNPNDPTSPLGTFTSTSGLYDWLDTYYHLPSVDVQPATTTTLGGVIINNEYLTIASDGTLGVDRNALDIPTISTASFASEGTIKLGNSSVISSNFADNTLTASIVSYTTTSNDSYSFPVRLDANHRAGITIPTELFAGTQVQSNWTQSDPSMKDYIQNKPTFAAVATSGSYNDLTNKPTITTYTAGDNITITDGVISATGYDNFVGTDGSTDGEAGLVPAPEAATDVDKYLKSDGTWEDPNAIFKNQRVVSVSPKVYDEYSSHFDLYNIVCDLSDDNISIANKNDFRKAINGYTNVVYPASGVPGKSYVWTKTANDTNCYIGIYGTSVAAKGLFKLKLHNDGDPNNVYSVYDVGFIIDSPTLPAFAWFTDLSWDISVRVPDGLIYPFDTNILVYVKVPDNFVGTITLIPSNLIAVANKGDNVGCFYNSTNQTSSMEKHAWKSTEESTVSVGLCTVLLYDQPNTPYYDDRPGRTDRILIPNPAHVNVDAFIDTTDNITTGDVLYDNVINDYIIHTLVRRVNSMQDIIDSMSTRLNQLNIYTQPSN